MSIAERLRVLADGDPLGLLDPLVRHCEADGVSSDRVASLVGSAELLLGGAHDRVAGLWEIAITEWGASSDWIARLGIDRDDASWVGERLLDSWLAGDERSRILSALVADLFRTLEQTLASWITLQERMKALRESVPHRSSALPRSWADPAIGMRAASLRRLLDDRRAADRLYLSSVERSIENCSKLEAALERAQQEARDKLDHLPEGEVVRIGQADEPWRAYFAKSDADATEARWHEALSAASDDVAEVHTALTRGITDRRLRPGARRGEHRNEWLLTALSRRHEA